MKALFLIGLAAAASATTANAQVLFNNGPVVGSDGLSVLSAPYNTFGFGAQTTANNAVAEDFTVTGPGWNVTSLNFYGYQTNSTAFTFQDATWSVVSGDVNTGTVLFSGTTAVTSGGLVGYRVQDTTLTNTQRGIYEVRVDVPDFSLGAGTYWLRWSLTGTLASGPWQPPTSDSAIGNAAQSQAGAAFATLVEAGSGLNVSLPFQVIGAPVPEPGTYALMLAGGVAVAGLVRRRRKTA